MKYCITPLGAAIVEAMPDREMVKKIERDFAIFKICPMSAIFDFTKLRAFYNGAIVPMPQHLYRRK